MSPAAWVAFVAACAFGAVVRYLADRAVSDRVRGVFPWGTVVVNVTGSFVLGFLTGLALYHSFPSTAKVVLGTGFCGAYTTFSTFTFETIRLAEEDAVTLALRNVAFTLVVGALAAAAGIAAASPWVW